MRTPFGAIWLLLCDGVFITTTEENGCKRAVCVI